MGIKRAFEESAATENHQDPDNAQGVTPAEKRKRTKQTSGEKLPPATPDPIKTLASQAKGIMNKYQAIALQVSSMILGVQKCEGGYADMKDRCRFSAKQRVHRCLGHR